jgi:hypothetical protein
LLNGRASVNIITENLWKKESLPKPKLVKYHLRNGKSKYDKTFRNHKFFEDSHTWYTICSHIYYIQNSVVDFCYSMLLGRPWLRNAKVTHD